jgi:hypothetical protein
VRQRDLRIVVRHRGGRPTTVDYRGENPRWRARPGSLRVESRLADPTGGRRQGLLVWRIPDGMTCYALGDLVDGEVGAYDPRIGAFTEYPVNEGANCGDPRRLDRAVGLSVSTGPGLVTVVGFARADVTAATVIVAGEEKPAEITRSRVFAALFRGPDGPGAIPDVRVRAALRDGSVVEERLSGRA